MVGTGLDLTQFLNSVVEDSEPGIHSFFVDHTGAIQLHHNLAMIDFGTVANSSKVHKTLNLIFENTAEQKEIYKLMEELALGHKQVGTTFVDIQGKRQLAGIVYLPEIDWYEMTLIDLDTFLPVSHFTSMVILFVVTLLAALLLMNIVLTRLVLNPISQLDKAMGVFEKGKKPTHEVSLQGHGEIGRLIKHFMQMTDTVLQSRRDLEKKIQDRTAELERLVVMDPLTELYNRRGITEHITSSLNRAEREQLSVGLLWIDIDWFKNINDNYGHAAGDEVLKAIAKIIRETIRRYDVAARWGGDEFLVLLSNVDEKELEHLALRLSVAIKQYQFSAGFNVSISIGGAMHIQGQSIDTLLLQADQALYQAKDNGRDSYILYS